MKHTKPLPMLSGTLEEVLKLPAGPCASVLVNLLPGGNSVGQNPNKIERALALAFSSIDILRSDEDTKEALKSGLESAADSFNNNGSAKAIGLFASTEISKLVEFPFQVNESVVVGPTFQVRDVLYLQQYLEPYYALRISSNAINLYRGSADSLVEVRNDWFPAEFEDDFEYERASLGSSYGYSLKGFEKDQKSIATMREESFVKSVARHLLSVVDNPHALVVACGPPRLINEVTSVYPYAENIQRVDAAFNQRDFREFTASVWSTVVDARAKTIEDAINRIDNLPLHSRAKGLRKVWEAAEEGRGLCLYVERDYQHSAYRLKETDTLRLHRPKGESEHLADAVDDAIESVLRKHGRIVLTEPGVLHRYEGIVMTLRY